MSYRVNHVNKKTGVTYVYEAVSIWDKKKKQSRNKQVCVGKLDPVTGEFIPSNRSLKVMKRHLTQSFNPERVKFFHA